MLSIRCTSFVLVLMVFALLAVSGLGPSPSAEARATLDTGRVGAPSAPAQAAAVRWTSRNLIMGNGTRETLQLAARNLIASNGVRETHRLAARNLITGAGVRETDRLAARNLISMNGVRETDRLAARNLIAQNGVRAA